MTFQQDKFLKLSERPHFQKLLFFPGGNFNKHIVNEEHGNFKSAPF